MNEQEKFLSDLDIKTDDILEQPLEVESKEPEKEAEDDEMKAKNRRERRLLEKNQQLREEAIATNARLQALTEAQGLRKDSEPAEYLKRIEKIYGNATPEAIEATELLKEAFAGVELSAQQKAFERLESQRTSESEEVKKEKANLDDVLDSVEDDYGIDMSGDDRTGFLNLLEKLSPKDRDGNIIEYADPDTTAELYLERKGKSNDRAKELASRSMTRSGSSAPSNLEDDAAMRYLKENDII